jgi:3-phenylpropionate/cinnamic acid dioxygenase small subunit
MNADDRQAILDLIAQYGHTSDTNDVEGFLALFHDDAVQCTYVAGQTEPLIIRQSNSERRAFMLRRRGVLAQHGVQTHRYQTNSVLTEVGEGHVRAQTTVLVTHQRPGEAMPQVVGTGIYRDEFRRSADGWKFSRREGYLDQRPREY